MKFLIIGDLHGKIPKIHFKEFDAIIAPGDFCSDERKDLVWKSIKKKGKETSMWYDICGKKEAKMMIDKSIKSGRKVLEYLNSFNKPVFIVSGNWDYIGVPLELIKGKNLWDYALKNHYQDMIKGLKNIHDLSFKSFDFNGLNIIGYGVFHVGSGTAPEDRDDFFYAYSRLFPLFRKARKSKKPIIFLSHNVAYNTKIDKVLNKNSPVYNQHYGSVVVKELVKDFHPIINIGGHIHEHFGKCKVGKTVCMNAGFGPEVNTLLEIENNKINKLKFHKGKSKLYG